MRLLALGFVGLSLFVANAAQTTATKKKTVPKSSKVTAAHAPPLKGKVGTAKPSVAKSGTKSKRASPVARRPPVQMQPSTDRYKEIQQALADKGYFRGMPDGAWNGESVDALKRFQKDQNLDPDGKIGSLSLMALGLGPKRGIASAQTAPADPPPVAQPQP